MDEEHPRTEASINNRSHLRQILNMEVLYRKNKVTLCLVAGRWLLRCKCVTKEKQVCSWLFSLQLQVQNSPFKTLLEIIVKHHIKDLKNDKITSSESDPLLSARTVSSIAKSPAVTPTLMDDTKTEGSTPAIKLRYFANAVILNTLFCADLTSWKLFLTYTGSPSQVGYRRNLPFSACTHIIVAWNRQTARS